MTIANPDWNQVDTVLVDLDGTLLDLGFDDRFWRGRIPRAYAAHHGIDADEAWRRLALLFEGTRGTSSGTASNTGVARWIWTSPR